MNIVLKKTCEAKIFYNDNLSQALHNCLDEGYNPLFMPDLVDARIAEPENDELWNTWWSTPSLKVTGRTKQGAAVVVYAHVANYFSNPNNIAVAQKSCSNGAGKIPPLDFYRLLDLEDNKDVFVIDHAKHVAADTGRFSFKNALKHPQTIPFLGGRERAEAYFQACSVRKYQDIGIWQIDDDLDDEPRGRVLFLYYDYFGLGGNDDLDDSGRFVGVAPKAHAGKKLEQLLTTLQPFIAESNNQAVRETLTKLYKTD